MYHVIIKHNNKEVVFGPYVVEAIPELRSKIERGIIRFPNKYMFDVFRIMKLEKV